MEAIACSMSILLNRGKSVTKVYRNLLEDYGSTVLLWER